jgi:hypothetical protein
MELRIRTALLVPAFVLFFALGSTSVRAADADLRILVRGGCLDEANCCFGKWKMSAAADVYQTDDAIDKVASLKVGDEVEATSGRVHTDPGKLKIVYGHGEWKKGQIVGLYSEPDAKGKALIGTANDAEKMSVPFLKQGLKCDKPSKDCWAVALSHPKIKWMIKVKLPEDQTGWVDSTHVATDTECQL